MTHREVRAALTCPQGAEHGGQKPPPVIRKGRECPDRLGAQRDGRGGTQDQRRRSR